MVEYEHTLAYKLIHMDTMPSGLSLFGRIMEVAEMNRISNTGSRLYFMLMMIAFSWSGIPNGFAANPIMIHTIEDLQKIGSDPAFPLDGYFALGSNIDVSATAEWNDDGTGSDILEGFEPIGFYVSKTENEGFTGVFDGWGHVITGLTINRPGENGVGLFAYIGEGGLVRNLTLAETHIQGLDWTGSLAGVNGGIVADCAAVDVVVNGGTSIGGLIGFNATELRSCQSTGHVTGYWDIGGLVGVSSQLITYCQSSATVDGRYRVGGFIGHNYDGRIEYCFASGDVSGPSTIGGFAGRHEYNGSIKYCYASGDVTGETEPFSDEGFRSVAAAGLIADNRGDVTECFATGNISGYETIGGLLGRNEGDVTNCYATGSVTKVGRQNAGGLVGYHNSGRILYCYAVGQINAIGYCGGLIGFTGASCSNSFWDINTTGLLTSSGGGTGLSTSQMTRQMTYTDANWDFVSVWKINEGVTYPELQVVFDPVAPENAVADWLMWE